MRRSSILLLLLFGLLSLPLSAQITVYVVRHAEKDQTTESRDPELSEAGEARAKALVHSLKDAGVERLMATRYKRTQATLAPLAKKLEREVETYTAGQEKDLGAKILKEMKGKTLAVAGHSNTVPEILKALGIAEPPKLDEKAYDDLFVVTIDEAGKARLQHLHYGAPDAD